MEKTKDFRMDYSSLPDRARTLQKHFENNLASFTAFDPDYNAAYAASWLALIEECEEHPDDESTVDELAQYTKDLEEARKEGFIAANDLEHYVKKAFPDDEMMLEEFGFSERKKARARSLNQLIWLEVMKRVAADYTAELAAVNMPPSVINNLETKQQNAVQKEIAQEYFKRIRKRLARQRIKKFNNLYKICITVRDTAVSVFYNDAERRKLFEIEE